MKPSGNRAWRRTMRSRRKRKVARLVFGPDTKARASLVSVTRAVFLSHTGIVTRIRCIYLEGNACRVDDATVETRIKIARRACLPVQGAAHATKTTWTSTTGRGLIASSVSTTTPRGQIKRPGDLYCRNYAGWLRYLTPPSSS